MKLYAIAICVATFLTSASAASDRTPPYANAEERFTTDAKVESEFDRKGVLLFKFHSGTYEGMAYKFFPGEGSGRIGQWHLQCHLDAIDDTRSCVLVVEGLAIGIDSKGVANITVGYRHRPGSAVAIRLDSQPPLTGTLAGWAGATAQSISDQMQQASRIVTRYVQWPNEVPTDNHIDPQGLKQALDFAKWAQRAK